MPEELFSRSGDGHQAWCKGCFAGYRRGRPPTGAPRDRARAYVLDLLRRTPCRDCGEDDPVVLEFDHIGDKRADIATLVGRGAPLARIERELRACEVVCVNCHRRRTAARTGSWRLAPEAIPSHRPARRRNMLHIARWLRSGCVDCGETDIVVLDFDHRDGKASTVSRLVRNECSLERIDLELDRCDVRCACCHRRRTTTQLGWWRGRSRD